MRTVLMILFCFSMLCDECLAIDPIKAQSELLQTDRVQNALPESAEDYMDGIKPESSGDFFQQALRIAKRALSECGAVWKSAGKTALKILSVTMICTVSALFMEKKGEKAAKIASLLAIAGFCLSDISVMIGLGKQTMQELSDFSAAMIPVLVGAATASGAATTSAAVASGTVFFLRVLINAFQDLLTPMIYAIIAFSLANGISENPAFGRIQKFLSSLLKNGLKILMFLFSGWLSLTGIISGSADAMAVKAAKLTASTFVPVVGAMVSDASETVLVSAGLLKNSIGVFGMLAVFSIMLVPFLKIGIHYLVMQFTEFLALMVGQKEHTDFLQALSSGMGNLLGVICCCSLMLFLSCICVMKVSVQG